MIDGQLPITYIPSCNNCVFYFILFFNYLLTVYVKTRRIKVHASLPFTYINWKLSVRIAGGSILLKRHVLISSNSPSALRRYRLKEKNVIFTRLHLILLQNRFLRYFCLYYDQNNSNPQTRKHYRLYFF